MRADWTRMSMVANLLLEQELQKMRIIQEEHEALQRKRSKLTELNQAAQRSLVQVQPAHRMDADVHWQAWVSSNEQQLNLQAARNRALREIHLPAVLRAFGKKQVTLRLAKDSVGRSRYG